MLQHTHLRLLDSRKADWPPATKLLASQLSTCKQTLAVSLFVYNNTTNKACCSSEATAEGGSGRQLCIALHLQLSGKIGICNFTRLV